jgi:YVTN family beta-propeller protein
MNFRRVTQLGLVLALALCAVACNDTFRPIVIPLNPNPPSGNLLHYAITLSTNGVGLGCPPPTPDSQQCVEAPGASSRIDVSGDTEVSSVQMGLGPVHGALLPGGSELYVANSLDDSVSAYNPSSTSVIIPTIISLPAGSVPIFVATTEDGNVYVANSGTGTVAAINTISNVAVIIPLSATPAAFRPVAMAETPNGQKLYVANEGNNSVSVITTSDRVAHTPIPVGMSPVWAAVRSDGRRAYVLNSGSGTISTLDTTTDAVLNTVPVSAGANFMFYDSTFNRLYVTSNSATTVGVLDVSGDQPSVLASIDLTAGVNSPCAGGCVPTAVTVLPDGSRAYVSFYTITGTPSVLNASVAVINTGTKAITKFVSLPPTTIDPDPNHIHMTGCGIARFRLFVAAAPGDGSRVYVSNCDSGNTAVLQTLDDTFALNLPAPLSVFPTPTPGSQQPLQNPVFVFPGQ